MILLNQKHVKQHSSGIPRIARQLAATPRRDISRKHHVRVAIEKLKKGEALMISRQAFDWKNRTPKLFCNQISKRGRKRFLVSHNVHGTGWIVERTS